MNVTMKAPSNLPPTSTIILQDGTTVVVDAFGYITADSKNIQGLETGGFIVVLNTNDTIPNDAYNAQTNTAAANLTASNMVARHAVVNMTGTLAGAATLTLPTVAALVAFIPEWVVGMSMRMRLINSGGGAFAWTLTTATGWTLNGTMSVAQNTWRDFLITFQSATTATIQQVGTGTNS